MPSPLATSAPASASQTPPKARAPRTWRTNLVLFLATVASVLVTGADEDGAGFFTRTALTHGAQFAASLLTILVAHELGHYVAARLHGVEASLPFFLPLPLLSPFGTMGAVIRMRGTIPTRRALLDIGAAGPLAGLAFAIPLYAWGVSHAALVAQQAGAGMELGDSVLLRLLDHAFAPAVPAGMELELSPVAFGAWAGFFVTMINLLPVGQLDGGHVAYALFGPRQDRFALVVHRAMLVFFFVSVGSFVARDVRTGLGFPYVMRHLGEHVESSLFWLVWFEVIAILGALASPESRSASSAAGAGVAAAGLGVRTRAFAILGLALLPTAGRVLPPLPFWASWFAALGVLLAMEARGGVLTSHRLVDHPPTGRAPLDPLRTAVAIVALVFFALLFMPTPFIVHVG